MNNKITLSIIAILFLFVIGSCEREIESGDPVRSIPDVGPTIVNLQAAINNESITLTWDVVNGTGVSKYRVYQSNAEDLLPLYNIVDSSATTSVDITNLQINTTYNFKVAAVTAEGLEWDPSEAVDAEFNYLSLSIENGKEYTNKLLNNVYIHAPVSTSHVMLSEDINFEGAKFTPFLGTGTPFEISSGDGTKWVYCKLQYQNGSMTGAPLSDSIILDTKAEIQSLTYNNPDNGDYFEAGELINFELDANETGGTASVRFGSGSNFTSIDLFDDGSGSDITADDGIYTSGWNVPDVFNAYGEEVSALFIDEAGNSANSITDDDLIYIYTPPAPVLLSALTESTHQIRLFWNLSTSDNFAAFRIFRATSPGVSDQSLQISFFGSNVDNVTDNFLDDDTRYYYIIYTYDKSGLSSASNVINATTLINTAPEAVDLFAEIGTSTTTVELNWSKSDEDYFDSYRVYRNTVGNVSEDDDLVTYITNQSSLSASVPLEADITNYFKIYVVDRHGLSTGSSPEVSVDAPPSP